MSSLLEKEKSIAPKRIPSFLRNKNNVVKNQIWWQTNPENLHTWQRGFGKFTMKPVAAANFIGFGLGVYGLYCLVNNVGVAPPRQKRNLTEEYYAKKGGAHGHAEEEH